MELGNKPLKGTLIEDDSKYYPCVYLNDADVAVIGDYEVGDEVKGTVMVRVSEVGHAKDGSRSAELEILDMTLAEKDKPTAADRAYPTMSKATD